MHYRGYHIIAEINVNSQWEFEEENGFIHLTNHIDDGEADEDNLADFLVQDPDGEDVDWRDTLAEAKQLIDNEIDNTNAVTA